MVLNNLSIARASFKFKCKTILLQVLEICPSCPRLMMGCSKSEICLDKFLMLCRSWMVDVRYLALEDKK